MTTFFDTFRPKSQAECDHANTLREYEAAHRVWMNTSIFDAPATRDAAKRNLDTARANYVAAVKSAHPTWIVC